MQKNKSVNDSVFYLYTDLYKIHLWILIILAFLLLCPLISVFLWQVQRWNNASELQNEDQDLFGTSLFFLLLMTQSAVP